MKVRTAGWIFFIGTGVSLAIFLALTFDTFSRIPGRTHEDRLTPDVVAGKWVWQKYNCNDCHTILGIGGYYAPDVTRVRSTRDPDWLAKFLQDPHAVWPAKRRMPTLGLTDEEIKDLVAFLSWVNEIDTNNWPPRPLMAAGGALGSPAPGMAVYQEQGCSACHRLNGSGGEIGPDLTHVAGRRDRAWILQQLQDPKSHNSQTVMPSFSGLPPQKLADLADYLAGLK